MSPPSQTAMAPTCTVVTSTASTGHGPAIGWPTAAVLPTSPSASTPAATRTPRDGGAAAAPGGQQHRPELGDQQQAHEPSPAHLGGGGGREQGRVEGRAEPRAGRVRALQQQAGRRTTAPATRPRPSTAGASSDCPTRRASRPPPAPGCRPRAPARRSRASARPAAGRRPTGSTSPSPADAPAGHQFAVADDEGERARHRMRVGGDHPVGDQVAGVGEVAAQRDGEHRRRPPRRRRCRPGRRRRSPPGRSPAPRETPSLNSRVTASGAVSSRAPSPGVGRDERGVRGRRPGETHAGQEQAGQEGEQQAAAPHAATRAPTAAADRLRRARHARVATSAVPAISIRCAAARSRCTWPAPRSARVTGTRTATKDARNGQRTGGQARRRRDGEEGDGHAQVPGARSRGPGGTARSSQPPRPPAPARRAPPARPRRRAGPRAGWSPRAGRGPRRPRRAARAGGPTGRRRSGRAPAARGPAGPAGSPGRPSRAQTVHAAHPARCSSSRATGIPRGSPSSRAEIASR